MDWNVEKMTLMNESNNVYIKNRKIYHCESSTSRDEKVEFVDRFNDGKFSYLLSLIAKFEQDKETLPKSRFDEVKSTSLKAWIKRNDTKYGKPLIDDTFNYGMISFLGSKRNVQYMHNSGYDTYDDWVDECFHRQLVLCEKEERKYFEEHDEYCVLKRQVQDKMHITTFGVPLVDCSDGRMMIADESGDHSSSREITVDELKALLAKYQQVDALIDKLTQRGV